MNTESTGWFSRISATKRDFMGTSQKLSHVTERLRQIVDGLDQESLQKDDRYKNDDRRKIDPSGIQRQHAANPVEHRLGRAIEKTNDRIVGIGVDPRDNRSGDNDPHIGRQ